MKELGVLTKVPLRKFWEDEEVDFTPWLAREENIRLLSETVRMELEVEGTEIKVGPFEADILCRDTATDKQVVIENQLEPTDHKHLGQLLTYAAGLEAVTVVWIAERFTDEHRAALDWLNEITAEGFSFFGLEIELWRIGDSPMAPKFNVVSHPNNWTKTVDQIVHRQLTPVQQFYREYWIALLELIEERNGVIKPVEPGRLNWLPFAVGPSGFKLQVSLNVTTKSISVSLWLIATYAKRRFDLLEQDRVDIEKEIGVKLEWEERSGLQDKHIRFSLYDADPEDLQDWDRQHQWLCEQLETFHNVFSPRVKTLDASDNIPDENETIE